ncbi:hypothetical protein EDB83DRAFT_2319472 [Lactarius deliciosus]|nr:hypothetical protein EDB83DRAFT_2319472 [Lactarius deliciosus]
MDRGNWTLVHSRIFLKSGYRPPLGLPEFKSIDPNLGASEGRVPSQSHGSNPTRYNLPRCKMPQCDKPAIFDQHINEQLMWSLSDSHLAVRESCSNLNVRRHSVAPPGTPGYNLQHTGQQMVSPTAHTPTHVPPSATAKPPSTKLCENCRKMGKGPCSRDCAAAGNLKPRIQTDRIDPHDGLGQTCQECRSVIKDGHGRYCSKRSEEASRKRRTSRPQ